MCNECVEKEFPEERPIRTERPEREWPNIDKDPPERNPKEDPDDRIRCEG